ncbi:MAG TPA: PaaX family transcriptional regulator C-terminal domain-containing protein [Aquihabitans sp.]|jgi:phenylacetic acid degradation operon negative regulatory protein|nr:PaaX family transcriptional regulator C-terminal domain-containing protein [Aquihabitans sp.]
MPSTRNTPAPVAGDVAAPAVGRLTARSVIASTLLGVSPPELPTRSLVATAELLGVAPGTARVAMSRMVAAGELEATGDGYRLVGRPLLTRRSRQELSRRGPAGRWDGTWRTGVVTTEGRTAGARAELRAAMGALRFGELREGVWLRPDNLPAGALPDQEALVAAECTWVRGRPEDPVAVVTRCWDLDGWARRAAALQREVDRLGARLADHDHTALAEGFVASAAVLRHLQADPLLPPELTPDAWPGPALRRGHAAYDDAFKATLAAWLRGRRS